MRQGFVAAVIALCFATIGQAQTIYFSDFEADDGGWTGTGDWQWGSPNGFDTPPFGNPEPVGGFSGNNAWGTVIGGAHSPSTVSDLSLVVDLSTASNVMLSFWEWSDSGSNQFDTATIFANGDEIYFSDGGPTTDWRQVELDLSAYDGLAAVNVNFQFSSTGVVERVGWYVDDVAFVSAIPEPTHLGLLGLGFLYASGRRRK